MYLQPSSEAPSIWLALSTIVGLPAALWAYKCAMMVLFQRKIIYMGYVPPGARTEELGVDVPMPRGILCEEIRVQSERRVELYGITMQNESTDAHVPDVVLVYLQGNAGNPLARIPVFERLLTGISGMRAPSSKAQLGLRIIAVAPRSYWKSSSRTPTQRGLLADYTSILSYARDRYPRSTIVLYGHSLGGAIAVCLVAQLNNADYPSVRGIILENPFSSIPGMVQALYPQRWLPYRYLAPLAFDKWDALAAVRSAKDRPDSLLAPLAKNVLVLLSEKDEVVPTTMGVELFRACDTLDASATEEIPHVPRTNRQVVIRGSLHENAWTERQWINEMKAYLYELVKTRG